MGVTEKQVKQALVNINHNTTELMKTQVMLGEQHKDIIGELKTMNSNTFRLWKYILGILFAIMGGAFALVGVKILFP